MQLGGAYTSPVNALQSAAMLCTIAELLVSDTRLAADDADPKVEFIDMWPKAGASSS